MKYRNKMKDPRKRLTARRPKRPTILSSVRHNEEDWKKWEQDNRNYWKWSSSFRPYVAHDENGKSIKCPKCRSVLMVHHHQINGVEVIELECKKNDHILVKALWRETDYLFQKFAEP